MILRLSLFIFLINLSISQDNEFIHTINASPAGNYIGDMYNNFIRADKEFNASFSGSTTAGDISRVFDGNDATYLGFNLMVPKKSLLL